MSMTPGEWKYGVRKDGSMWLSIGDYKTGPHYQGDLVAHEDDASAIAALPDLVDALKSYESWADKTICTDPELRAIREKIRAALNKAGVTHD